MKVASPRLLSQITTLSFLDMEAEGELENASISEQDGMNLVISGLQLDGVIFDKVQLAAGHFERMGARDVVFKRSDVSSAAIVNGAINRGLFDNCRMIGIDFNKTALHDVVFRGCKLDMANFRFADLRRVQFVDCTLVETDFLGAILHDVTFESCELDKTVFDQVKCKHVDLRGSELNEIVGWGSLKGATIDDAQLVAVAPYLAQEIGILVKK